MRDLDANAIVMSEKKRGTRMCFAVHKFARVRDIRCVWHIVPREKSRRKKLPAFPGEAAKRKCLGMHYHDAVSFHHSPRIHVVSFIFIPCINNYIFHLILIKNLLKKRY